VGRFRFAQKANKIKELRAEALFGGASLERERGARLSGKWPKSGQRFNGYGGGCIFSERAVKLLSFGAFCNIFPQEVCIAVVIWKAA